jgi:hypothetical protein
MDTIYLFKGYLSSLSLYGDFPVIFLTRLHSTNIFPYIYNKPADRVLEWAPVRNPVCDRAIIANGGYPLDGSKGFQPAQTAEIELPA